MIKKKIRAGVIGLGVGAHQARTLFTHPDCELVSICDFDKNKLAEISSELSNVNQTQDDQDILSDPDINLVCVASYDEFHYQQVIKSLNNGKHVYVEKPICLKKEELQDIDGILKKYPNLRISSNMVLRTCPLFIKVRDEVLSQKWVTYITLKQIICGDVKKKLFQVGELKQIFILLFMELQYI